MIRFPPVYRYSLLLALSPFLLGAQNLLKNPSFESISRCPDRLGNFHSEVADWSSPTLASTDYFNSCSTEMGTADNFNGSQDADFGKGYAGMYLFAPDDYREYVQGELVKTLMAGKRYEISFFLSLAERSDFAVKELGLVFSREKLELPIRKELSRMQLYKQDGNTYSFVQLNNPDFLIETKEWVRMNVEYTATGSENFLTIGNFANNARTLTLKTGRSSKKGAYYYIDMVDIRPAVAEPAAISADRHGESIAYTLDEENLFRNVLFDFNDFRLKPEAESELQKLYNYLKVHTKLNITINGHTDNVGPAAYNLLLSERRCKAVAEYLLQLGLGRERVRWISHGFNQPLADNSSEEGRRENRRVAFSLTLQSAD